MNREPPDADRPRTTPSLQDDPETAQRREADPRTEIAPPWHVIVHDDPITLMSYVTMVFQRLFGYPFEKAQRLMMEVHSQGRSLVWTGDRERAEFYVQRLHGFQLLATLELAVE